MTTEDAVTELARIRAGSDETPRDPACQSTAGQFWHWLLSADPTERIARLTRLLDQVYDCHVRQWSGQCGPGADRSVTAVRPRGEHR